MPNVGLAVNEWAKHVAARVAPPPDFIEISREEFIRRLLKAGWLLSQAEQEWEEIQSDEEGNL